MRKLASIMFCLFLFCFSYGQTDKLKIAQSEIKNTVISFLKWYKTSPNDTTHDHYSLIKENIINEKFKKQSIDKEGVEKYLDFLRTSRFLSEAYLNDLRGYFYQIDKDLDKNPLLLRDEIIKIDGLDQDIVLSSFEPELILDNLDKGVFKMIAVVSSKAIVQFYISPYSTKMLFTLSGLMGKWKIDSVGYYE